MANHWYALWVKVHKERVVAKQLAARDIDYFLPLIKVNPVNPRAAKLRPYFPGYMFIYFDLDDFGANSMNWLPGAHKLVSFGDEPVPIRPEVIRELEETIHKIELKGGIDHFEPGDRVRIKAGPFKDYEAIFDMTRKGSERVQVLLEFLGSQMRRIELDASAVEKISW